MGRSGHVPKGPGGPHPPMHHSYHHGPPPPPPPAPYRRRRSACCDSCIICGIVAIIVVIGCISSFSSMPAYIDDGELGDYRLSNGEQYLKYTGNKKIKAEFNSYYINAYVADGESHLVLNATKERYAYSKVKGNTRDIFYNSYLITPQSDLTIKYDVEYDDGEIIVIKGEDQFKNFLKKRYYNYIHSARGSGTFKTTTSSFDEYFVIINPLWHSRKASYEYTTTIDRTSFDVSSMTPVCENHRGPCAIGANRYALFTLKNPKTSKKYELKIFLDGLTTIEIVSIALSCVLFVVLVLVIVLMCIRCRKARKAMSEEEKNFISNSNVFVVPPGGVPAPDRTVVVIDDMSSTSTSGSSSYNSSSNGINDESKPLLNPQVKVLPPPTTMHYTTPAPVPGSQPPPLVRYPGQYPPPPPPGQYPPPPPGQYPPPPPPGQYPPPPPGQYPPPPPPPGQYPPAPPPGQYPAAPLPVIVEQRFSEDYPVAPPPPGTIN